MRTHQPKAERQKLLAAWKELARPPISDVRLRALRTERARTEGALQSIAGKYVAPKTALDVAAVQAALPDTGKLVEFHRFRPFLPDATRPADRWQSPRYVPSRLVLQMRSCSGAAPRSHFR